MERLVSDVAAEVALGAKALRGGLPLAAGLARRALGEPAAVVPAAGGVVAAARSIAGALGLDGLDGRPCSPIMVGRSASAVLGTLQVDLDAARRAGRAAGATVNDVFVAAVLEGLRRYHAKHGSRPDGLRVAVPIDLRGATDDDGGGALGGNAFFPTRLVLPLRHAEPADALRSVHTAVAAARAEPVLGLLDPLAAVGARLPAAEALLGRALAAVDVIASNVAGSPVPLELAGARVRSLVPFGPRSGAGCNITMLSYDGTLHVGVNLDPAATPDTDTVLDCLGGAFADLVGGS